MEKCAKLENLLMEQPDKLDFTVMDCGQVKIAGMDELFTMDEMNMMLTTKLKHPDSAAVLNELKMSKHAAIDVPKDAIPIRKEAENSAVVVDMYEVSYIPENIGQSTQEINKQFNANRDFVSRMQFPDTTVADIIVGPKEQIFKKHEEKVRNPQENPNAGAADTPAQLKQGVWTPVSIWKKASPQQLAMVKDRLDKLNIAFENCYKSGSLDSYEKAVKWAEQVLQYFTEARDSAWKEQRKTIRRDNSMIRAQDQFDENELGVAGSLKILAGVDSLTTMIEEGLKDETEGHEFWSNTAQALRGAGMPDEAKQAEQFANQETGHYRFLETLKIKTSPGASQRSQDEKSEPILRFMKRNYDMLPSDVVRKARENFRVSEKDAWVLYQKVKAEFGERKGVKKGWRKMADDSFIQMSPTFGLPQGLPQGFTGTQQTQSQGQQQGIPQEAGQYGRQPDGLYRYMYQNASVLVNPNLNNIIVNVWVNGSDENSIQVGLNSATQIANNAATVYARTIQMPVQLLSRLNHTVNGNYITVPFTFQANKIEQSTPTQQGQGPTATSSWKSMQALQ